MLRDNFTTKARQKPSWGKFIRERIPFFSPNVWGVVRSNRGTEWMDNDQYLGADTKQKPDVCYLAANQTTGQFLFHRKHLFLFIARRSRMEIARWQDRDGHNVSSERWETKSLCDKNNKVVLGLNPFYLLSLFQNNRNVTSGNSIEKVQILKIGQTFGFSFLSGDY